MSDITVVLDAIQSGDPDAPGQLLPMVYEELRRLARHRLAHEAPGQTLQPTALVHEAYLRLVADERGQHWNSRGHFFSAAAEAMRRILVENARRKRSLKRGGALQRQELDEAELLAPEPREDLVALDEALTALAATDRTAAELIQLRYFGGLSTPKPRSSWDFPSAVPNGSGPIHGSGSYSGSQALPNQPAHFDILWRTSPAISHCQIEGLDRSFAG